MKIHYFFILLLTVSIWASCEKEVQINDDDKGFPLTLNHLVENGTDKFYWSPVNVRGFERYVLTRSGDPIPVGASPNSSQTIFQSSKVTDTTAFSSASLFFDSIGYYKLYAQVEGRWLESDQILIQSQSLILSGIPNAATFFADSNWVIIMKTENFSSLSGKLVLVDLDNNKTFSSSIPFPISSNDQIAMRVGFAANDGTPELYVSTSSAFRKLSLPNLVQKVQHTSYSVPFSVASGGGNSLFTTNGLSSTAFNVRRKSDFSLLKSHTRSNYFDHRTLAVLDTNTNLVVEASSTATQIFNVSPSNGVVSNLKTISEIGNSVFLFDMPVSPNRQYFCPNTSGVVYDKDLNVVVAPNSIGGFNSSVTAASFGLTNEHLYVFAFDFFTGESNINKFNILTNSIEAQFPIVNNFGVAFLGRTNKGLTAILTNQLSTGSKYVVQTIDF